MGNEQGKQINKNTYARQSSSASVVSSKAWEPIPEPIMALRVKQKFFVDDKVSYHFDGVRSLATVKKVEPIGYDRLMYTIHIDGTACTKTIPHTDENLMKAEFTNVERNWGRMGRDAERRQNQKKHGYKCNCDPNYECICHLMVSDMRPRIELPKPTTNHSELQNTLDKFIHKHTSLESAESISPSFTYIGYYLTNREYKEGDAVIHKVGVVSTIYYAIGSISKNYSPLAGLPWIKVDSFKDGKIGIQSITICGIVFTNIDNVSISRPIDIDADSDDLSDDLEPDWVANSPKDDKPPSPIAQMTTRPVTTFKYNADGSVMYLV
jgi:hypothetical protein